MEVLNNEGKGELECLLMLSDLTYTHAGKKNNSNNKGYRKLSCVVTGVQIKANRFK